jgi:hypothetical protein
MPSPRKSILTTDPEEDRNGVKILNIAFSTEKNIYLDTGECMPVKERADKINPMLS